MPRAYLEFPVVGKYRISRSRLSPFLLAGLASGLKLSCHEEWPSVETILILRPCLDNLKTSRWDHSVLLGAGFELGTRRLRTTAEATFSRALNNMFTGG